MLALLGLLVLVIGLAASIFYIPSRRTYRMMKKLPGPNGFPLIGIGFELACTPFEDLLDFLMDITQLPGRVKSFWVTGLPVVILCEPEDYEVMLKSTININKGVEYDTLRWTLNDGLLISKADKWRVRRRLLNPAFNYGCLETYAVIINRNARILTENLLGRCGNESVDIFSWVSRCTLDIISESITGVALKTQTGESGQFTECLFELSKMLLERVKNPLYRSDTLFWLCRGMKYRRHVKYFHDFTQNIINQRKKKEQANCPKKAEKFKTMLDTMIDLQKEHKNITDLDIREEINTFLGEGQHTMARGLCFCIYTLGLHPNILEDLYEEQVEIFGANNFTDIKNEDIVRMKSLDRVIKETLRLYPPSPYFSRLLTEDLRLNDGTIIPSGVNLLMIPYILHRNPRVFPQPERFDPNRFTVEDTIKRHPYAYLPFSGGQRNCIGQKFAILEMKIVLSFLIRSMVIETVTSDRDSGTLKVIPSIVLTPCQPIMVKLLPRVQSIFRRCSFQLPGGAPMTNV